MIGKAVLWLVIIILVVYAINNPAVAGHNVRAYVTDVFTFIAAAGK